MNDLRLPKVSLGALVLVAFAGSASAVESLGPNEAVAGVTWTTSGASAAIDTAGDPSLKDTLQLNADGPHGILNRTLSLLVLDTLTFTYRTIGVDLADPFWTTAFDFEPIELDEAWIPPEGVTASIPYLGKYGADGVFASAFYASTGFINGFSFPAVVDNPDVVVINPNLEVEGRSGSIDCCTGTDLRDITFATPSTEGRWLDLDGDQIADVNVEELLADKGIAAGDMKMELRNGGSLRPCEILPDLRFECMDPPSQVLATTFTIPLQVVPPKPDQCDLNSDGKFGGADIKRFAQDCKAATAIWECDIDEDGQFSMSDSIRFVLGCGFKPATQANVEAASSVLKRAFDR